MQRLLVDGAATSMQGQLLSIQQCKASKLKGVTVNDLEQKIRANETSLNRAPRPDQVGTSGKKPAHQWEPCRRGRFGSRRHQFAFMRFNGQSARIEKQIVVESDRINIAKRYLDGSKEPEATRDGTGNGVARLEWPP
jgi:hypothetical protein